MMGKVTLRNLAAHKIRLVLTAIAVILGVAFVAGTLVFTDTMNKQFDDLFSRIGKGIAVDVRAKKVTDAPEDGSAAVPVPASVLERLKTVEGVKNPRGNVTGYAAVVGADGKIVGQGQQGPPQLGVNWVNGGSFELASGRAPQGPAEVAIDADSAKKGKLAVGRTVQVVTAGPPQRMTITGLIDTGNLMGATVTAFDTPTAQRLLLKPGFFTDIEMGTTGPSETELRDRVAKVLPAGYEAITGTELREQNKSDVASFLGFFRTLLLVFALISIFVGAFIIFNTFSMLVAQRTRELALLRAIGAARRQVTRAVIGEAVAVGVVGSTFGLAAGVGLASVLQAFFSTGSDSGLTITATPVIASYAVGILVTVVSAYFPARRAAKIPPVAAMRDDIALPQRSLRIRIALGSLITLIGSGLIGVGLTGTGDANPAIPTGIGALLVFIGVAMLAPVISVPVVKVLGLPAAKLMGAPGRLARQNALRNPRRTAATAAALMIGLALITTVSVLGSTMRASLDKQVDDQFGIDYAVEATGGAIGADVLQKIKRTPGVETASQLYEGDARIKGKEAWYVAGDAGAAAKGARLKMVAGSAALGPAGIMVDEGTAKKNGWTIGSSVPVQFADGRTEQLRLAGIYAKNELLGPRFVAQQAHLRHTVRPTADLIIIDAATTGPATRTALEETLRAHPNLKVTDQSSLKEDLRKEVDGFVTFLTILLAMSVIIAAVGVINTLALSVIERTREIGLLRAIGISRRQLRRMIRMESIVIALFGAGLGLAIGMAFGTALQNALADKGLAVLSFPVAQLAAYVAVGGVIGVLAALWPAWRAGRMDVLKAISTE
ncbi:ABC transporter permease [Spirillospora albida]|uniref:ABC transporter permease n=1 Tax=Spirillospora albida TaxID=58123 RepID=UPI000A44CCEB|nr:FtsX family ABC transporter permease [Spirillospora albida]